MKLYVNHLGQWAGNQEDAKKLGHSFETCDVPYDKKGLLEFLNANQVTLGSTSSEGHDPERIPSQKPNYVDPIVVTSGNTTSTPLAYVKDGTGISEIENVYKHLVTAHLAMKHVMESVGYVPRTTLFKEEE